MTKPKQRVIIYDGGTRAVPKAKSLARNEYTAEARGATEQCPRCFRYLKNPAHRHKSDPKNNIPCIERLV